MIFLPAGFAGSWATGRLPRPTTSMRPAPAAIHACILLITDLLPAETPRGAAGDRAHRRGRHHDMPVSDARTGRWRGTATGAGCRCPARGCRSWRRWRCPGTGRRRVGGDRAAQGAGVGAAELRVIQHVHRIGADLELQAARDVQRAADAQVDIEPVVGAKVVIRNRRVAVPELVGDDASVRRRHHAAGKGVRIVFEVGAHRRRDDPPARQRDRRASVVPARRDSRAARATPATRSGRVSAAPSLAPVTAIGKPVCQMTEPPTCQPPTIARSTAEGACSAWSRPNGSS